MLHALKQFLVGRTELGAKGISTEKVGGLFFAVLGLLALVIPEASEGADALWGSILNLGKAIEDFNGAAVPIIVGIGYWWQRVRRQQ